MFVDSFIDDLTYIRDVKFCMEGMNCHIPGSICYGLRIFDCALCMIAVLDLLAHPQSSIPKVQMGLITAL